jgi:osmoprotectant transport system permease protein
MWPPNRALWTGSHEGRPGVIHQLIDWLSDPEHWRGIEGVPARVLEHVELSFAALAIAMLIAIPIGLFIGHVRRFELVATVIALFGRAIPSIAYLSIAFLFVARWNPRLAFGFVPALVALVLLGAPPILTNAYVGIQQVDPDMVEAARGMGMRPRQVLTGLELPLALPLLIAGIRIAAVQIVATATLSALIGGGTLGRYIISGFAQHDMPMVLAGAVLVAGLAIVTDVVFALIERVVTPRTSSRGRVRAPDPRGLAPETSPIR